MSFAGAVAAREKGLCGFVPEEMRIADGCDCPSRSPALSSLMNGPPVRRHAQHRPHGRSPAAPRRECRVRSVAGRAKHRPPGSALARGWRCRGSPAGVSRGSPASLSRSDPARLHPQSLRTCAAPLQTDLGRQIEDQCHVGHCGADRNAFERRHQRWFDVARHTLIHPRGIDEAVAEHDLATGQCRADDAVQMIGPGGREQQRLHPDPERFGSAREQDMSERLCPGRSARLTRRDTVWPAARRFSRAGESGSISGPLLPRKSRTIRAPSPMPCLFPALGV